MLLPVTLTIAAAAAFINFWIAMRCGQMRARSGVLVGDGGDPRLIAWMRAHANFVENMPFFLILLGLVELGGGTKLWLWLVAIVFVLARIAHALGMDRPYPNKLRQLGMGFTMLPMLGLAVYAIILSYGRM